MIWKAFDLVESIMMFYTIFRVLGSIPTGRYLITVPTGAHRELLVHGLFSTS